MAVTSRRRNSEKRKEKSRDAARCRRGKEAEIFSELAAQLPLPATTIDSLDKASVMRLLLSNLKVRSVMCKKPKLEVPEEGTLDAKLDTFYPKAMDGFMLLLSKEGDIIYISEDVIKFLGLQQIDVMGQSVFEYAHPCDHEEIQEVLSPRTDSDEEAAKTIFIRLKCTLTSKGRNVNLKSASYKVIKLTGRYIPDTSVETEITEIESDGSLDEEDEDYDGSDHNGAGLPGGRHRRMFKPCPMPHFLAVAEGIHHPSNIEVPLDRRTFTSRHSMNMKFTDCDERIKRLIGYNHEELIGQSFFGFHHATDSKMMEKAFKDLFSKGQTSTGQYRFLAKNGGYVWMVTEATVIYNSKSQKPECVVCVHYVLSHVEQHGRILAGVQHETSTTLKKEVVVDVLPQKEERSRRPLGVIQNPSKTSRRDMKITDIFHLPTFNTEAVFEAKTEDMDEEFYFPPGMKKTDGKTDLLNLSHLAPQDGDVCIPLDIPSLDKIRKVESFGSHLNLYDNYASMEDDDIKTSLPFAQFKERKNEDATAPLAPSPGKMSPDSTMQSLPSPSCYLTTINSQDISCIGEKFNMMDTADNKKIDFSLRAPYIPMTSEEDFSLGNLTSDTFLDMGADFNPGIFGSTESVFTLKDEFYDGPPPEKKSKTTAEMLGGNTVQKSMPQDQIMMRMKRPLDRSCLEKGPPVHKMLKCTQPPKQMKNGCSAGLIDPKKDNSVLMNLLLRGEDVGNGYSVKQKQNISQGAGAKGPGFLHHLLTAVTSHDVEANAPSNNAYLLQGQDIFTALNMSQK